MFEKSKLLSLLRVNANHSIVPYEGTNPINLRPFRYSSIQSNEIERQVKGLLEAGVIQNSFSPFSSLCKEKRWVFALVHKLPQA